MSVESRKDTDASESTAGLRGDTPVTGRPDIGPAPSSSVSLQAKPCWASSGTSRQVGARGSLGTGMGGARREDRLPEPTREVRQRWGLSLRTTPSRSVR